MTAKATQQSIKSILRRSSLSSDEPLNIITFCTHERYEQNLCKTNHNFYSLKEGKLWNTDYSRIPSNYFPVTEIPFHINFDLVLCHTSCNRINTSYQIRDFLNIPIVRHTHVLPDVRYEIDSQVQGFNQIEVDHESFISSYNRRAWGKNKHNASVIEHGVDCEFWKPNGDKRNPVCLSVVNDWPNRDWCCGWNLWNQVVKPTSLPVKVYGNNPGLSEAASSLEELRRGYQTSSIFLNTSLHSPVPTALMEAMACGCAIVSTNNCMIPEIITHNKNGLLSNDPLELKVFCEQLLFNPDEAKRLGDAARKTIEDNFNLSKFVDSWNSMFRGVIQNYRN